MVKLKTQNSTLNQVQDRQKRAPLLEALISYAKTDKVGFHTPGHKQGKGMHPKFLEFARENIFKIDLTVLPEVDCLFHPVSVIKEAQELAAEAYGADKTYFLLNGTTGGNHAMLLTPLWPGDKLIVGRNAHRSILAGLILCGANPVYVLPEIDERGELILNVTPEKIEETLLLHPEAKAVCVISPTYYGVCANLPLIEKIVHQDEERKRVFLVDEAWGGHLHFHPALPSSALSCGADIVVQSTHKILSGMTQASLLHVKGKRIDTRDLESVLRLVQTTSPSYILMASLDSARMQMATCGKELLQNAIELAVWVREKVNTIEGLKCFREEDVAPFLLDPTKILVRVSDLGISGYEAQRILNTQFGVQAEMADLEKVLFLITIGDRKEDAVRLVSSLWQMARKFKVKSSNLKVIPKFPELKMEIAMTPREAFFAKQKTVPFKSAIGKISTEIFAIYPPGLPVIVPGEIITDEAHEYLVEMERMGGIVDGPIDRNLDEVRIVDK